MKLLELTLPTAAENIALDEALLLDADLPETGLLRMWESPQYAVVLGRASRIAEEANLPWCESQRIPVIRRSSGGASILMGPGCLMYSLVLPESQHPPVSMISAAHEYVLGRMVAAIATNELEVEVAGTSDLVFRSPSSDHSQSHLLKFSGNSMRKSRDRVLYHGTILYNFDLELLGTALLAPPRTPAYRAGRSHLEFVANLPVRRPKLFDAIVADWNATRRAGQWPKSVTQRLVAEKYLNSEWNARR